MQKAFTILEIKAVQDGKKRSFTGIATTPAADRMEDVVEPLGAKFKLPIPLLWQHDSQDPIGWVTSAQVTDKGILIDGEIADIPDNGKLKDRLLEAWQMIKSGLVRGLSIGFRPIESEPIRTGGHRFTLWEWLELSAVTIPANMEANIVSVKQFSAGPAPTKKAGKGSVKLIPANYKW